MAPASLEAPRIGGAGGGGGIVLPITPASPPLLPPVQEGIEIGRAVALTSSLFLDGHFDRAVGEQGPLMSIRTFSDSVGKTRR